MKKITYSISSFKDIREQGLVYIDKTEFIKKYEDLNPKIEKVLGTHTISGENVCS